MVAAEQVTCTDQETAEVGEEPLVTLREFRSSAALGWQMPKSAVFFGWNIVPKMQGRLHVDDDVNVIKRRTRAVPSKSKRAEPVVAIPQEQQEEMLKGAGIAALQGIAAAICVASILISFMYILITSTGPQESVLQPT